ncbi:MAG: RNA polymerase sigma factor [Gammaproteobacteria bacterium]|nr:MAG: RNA polymerase sigma factor [Gammaproteobacteria bacterium]
MMLRYRDGDVRAFETLYRRHSDSLYRYLLWRSRNRAAAEDIFQEVWSNIIRSKQNYRATAKFSTFLYRVAHNCFIDHIRRNKRHAANTSLDPDVTMHPADQPDVTAEKTLARERLDAALAQLPDEQRDAFLLHEEAGLSLDHIARITGVNRETAKSRLRYAVKKLRTAIGDAAATDEKGI